MTTPTNADELYKHADCDKAIQEDRIDDACEGCKAHLWPNNSPKISDQPNADDEPFNHKSNPDGSIDLKYKLNAEEQFWTLTEVSQLSPITKAAFKKLIATQQRKLIDEILEHKETLLGKTLVSAVSVSAIEKIKEQL